ncbi:MAG: glycosyltransferase family 39 protein [Isosphaeraceae bacterium]
MSIPALARIGLRRHPVRPEPTPAPYAESRRTRRLARVGLVVVLAVFGARAMDMARSISIAGDEETHLTHCLHYWMTGDDMAMWELGAPRLPHVLYAFPSYLALRQANLLPDQADPIAIEEVVLSGAKRVVIPARVLAVAWGLALLLATYVAVARVHGAVPALIAAGLLSLVPEVIAHSAIAGSDVPFTASAFLALILLARFVEQPSPGRWVAVGLAIGLAWAMRHSALLLLMLAGVVHLWVNLRRPRPATLAILAERLVGSIVAGVGLMAIAAMVLWAGDGFGTISLVELSEHATTLNVPERIGPVDVSRWPIPTSVLSVLKQVRHQNQGHEAYFCGEYREQGWPLYFPVAFLLKTPIGLLILMIAAAVRVRPKGALDGICMAFLAVLWIMLVRNKVNIGVRYALLTYPLVMPFLVQLFERRTLRDWVWGPIVVASVAWFAWASFSCHPRYLSYFNEVGGGPSQGWLYLADSNLDWGQDFDTLAPTLHRLGINEVTTDLSTERRLDVPGLLAVVHPNRTRIVPAVTPPSRRLYDDDGGYLPIYTRYVAISVSRLHGLYSQNDMSWLRTRKLVTRIGDSTFVFDMDTPADPPFFR